MRIQAGRESPQSQCGTFPYKRLSLVTSKSDPSLIPPYTFSPYVLYPHLRLLMTIYYSSLMRAQSLLAFSATSDRLVSALTLFSILSLSFTPFRQRGTLHCNALHSGQHIQTVSREDA